MKVDQEPEVTASLTYRIILFAIREIDLTTLSCKEPKEDRFGGFCGAKLAHEEHAIIGFPFSIRISVSSRGDQRFLWRMDV